MPSTPLGKATEAAKSKLSGVNAPLPKLASSKRIVSRLNATRTGTMPTPNTSIQSTLTVTDINSNFVTNLSACNLTVKFPDGSTQALTLSSGITNAGNGQYQASYITKGVGVMVEVWSVVANDGITVGNFQFDVGVGF